jgi:hypothetical protein
LLRCAVYAALNGGMFAGLSSALQKLSRHCQLGTKTRLLLSLLHLYYTALPEGYAAVAHNGSILYSAGFAWSRVRNVTACPKGWWCAGGDPSRNATAKPVKCPDGYTTAAAGATSSDDCSSSGVFCESEACRIAAQTHAACMCVVFSYVADAGLKDSCQCHPKFVSSAYCGMQSICLVC